MKTKSCFIIFSLKVINDKGQENNQTMHKVMIKHKIKNDTNSQKQF